MKSFDAALSGIFQNNQKVVDSLKTIIFFLAN
ncbi:MAG: hypothetical protein ACI85O_000313, partial [Saprospiraceae bacterium]